MGFLTETTLLIFHSFVPFCRIYDETTGFTRETPPEGFDN